MSDDPGYAFSSALPSDELAENNNPRRLSQVEQVISELVKGSDAKFWRDPDGAAYATITLDGVVSRHRVNSRAFPAMVRYIYGKTNRVPGTNGTRPASLLNGVMSEVIANLEGMAREGPVRDPAVRVVSYEGSTWLDLGSDDCSLIRVVPGQWEHVSGADVPLVRPGGIEALPVPKHDAAAKENLRELLNIEDDDAFLLVLGWLVAALFPGDPCPVLALSGEQGSGKSLTARMLRRLVDPNKADLRSIPGKEGDLFLAATNSRILAFDNLTTLKATELNILCRLVTRGGFGKRQHYADTDEVLLSATPPIMFTGISNLLERPDFAERGIAIAMKAILDAKRQTEKAIWARFKLASPSILALVLDGVATAPLRLPTLELPALTRMADFAAILCAAAPALGFTELQAMAALRKNRATAAANLLDDDPLAEAMFKLADQASPNEVLYTATDLLALLNTMVPTSVRAEGSWPRTAAVLSNRLTQLQAPLRQAGLQVEKMPREGRKRWIKIVKVKTVKIVFKKSPPPKAGGPKEMKAAPKT
jgi:putative DNA primase/helicase